jgi:dienelactone hydrolase
MTSEKKSIFGKRMSGLKAAAVVFLLAWALVLAPVSSARQTQARPQEKPAAKVQRSPEQQEIAKIMAQIRELEGRIRELSRTGAASRYARDIERKKQTDEEIPKLCAGNLDYKKTSYKSRVDGLEIPVYLFQPLKIRGPKGHPALVWVHGGVHSNFGASSVPFIRQMTDRGYVVIAPDYRGSTGYGEEFMEAIDYGGYEVDDCLTAVDYLLANLPHVDPDRIGMIGWSHGGFITLHSLIRDQGKILKCGFAGVPVTNLVFRLSYKGPSYEANFVKQTRIGGEVHERRDIYIERSPVYHVDKIKVPVMVHVATNDQDVNFVEDQMMIHALEYHIPRLAETKVYVDPPGGHSFDRLVNRERTAPQNTEAQRDSWNRIWTFLETNLKPYLDGTGKAVYE